HEIRRRTWRRPHGRPGGGAGFSGAVTVRTRSTSRGSTDSDGHAAFSDRESPLSPASALVQASECADGPVRDDRISLQERVDAKHEAVRDDQSLLPKWVTG